MSYRGESDPGRGYLIELQPICMDHREGLTHPGNTVRGQHFPPHPPLTYGCVLVGPLYQVGILCIVTMAVYPVIEVSEVKRASGAGGHPKTM